MGLLDTLSELLSDDAVRRRQEAISSGEPLAERYANALGEEIPRAFMRGGKQAWESTKNIGGRVAAETAALPGHVLKAYLHLPMDKPTIFDADAMADSLKQAGLISGERFPALEGTANLAAPAVVGKGAQLVKQGAQAAGRAVDPAALGLAAALRQELGPIAGVTRRAKAASVSRVRDEPAPPLSPEERDANFKQWFGNSKVVDAEGKPRVVYHTTANDFDAFMPGGDDPTKSGRAIWLGTDPMNPQAAHNVLQNRRPGQFKEGTRTIPAHVRMERPLVIDDDASREWARSVWGDNFPQLIGKDTLADISRDYDGVLYHDRSGNLQEAVAFKPEQIKSAIGNSGLYDPTSASLTDRLARGLRASGTRSRIRTRGADGDFDHPEPPAEHFEPHEVPRLSKEASIAAGYQHPVRESGLGGKANLKRPVEQFHATHEEINPDLAPLKTIRPDELEVGSVLTPVFTDRTRGNVKVTSVGQHELSDPTPLDSGVDAMRLQQPEGAAWSNRGGAATAIQNNITELAKLTSGEGAGKVYGLTTAMGHGATDFNPALAHILFQQLRDYNLPRSSLRGFDKLMRETPQGLGEDWVGFVNPSRHEEAWGQIMADTNMRKAFIHAMQTEKGRALGLPDAQLARYAITHPDMLDVPNLSMGHSIGLMRPGADLVPVTNRTFPAGIPGQVVGGLEHQLHYSDVLPDYYKSRRKAGAQLGPPEQKQMMGRAPGQVVTREWQDNAMRLMEQLRAAKALGLY